MLAMAIGAVSFHEKRLLRSPVLFGLPLSSLIDKVLHKARIFTLIWSYLKYSESWGGVDALGLKAAKSQLQI